MKVFLSVGATYSETQERFVKAFEAFLNQNECQRLTVGRGNYDPRQPILQARELIEASDAVVVLAFTRTLIRSAIDKPGSKDEKEIKDLRYPTVWNQLEAAMAFGLKRPLLVIVENGLTQEAMLKDRQEFRAVGTALDVSQLQTDEFKGMFGIFKQIVASRSAEVKRSQSSPVDTWTVGELLRSLRPEQIWKVAAAVAGILSAIAVAAYWVAKHT
ncbi:MAG: hypothetical protein JO093_22575 [Acidobacteria bacterium]|nr:hypothetical protein [Acidobacteriota bacterium]MBV9071199.1 hypothetical protein [Acidobacteriota bacterium]MBV9188411.1 hypothetical protein [Acidobacteriota bacterium]